MKRMKYELTYLGRALLPLYLATLAAAAACRLMGPDATGWMQLLQRGIGVLTMILVAASLLLTILASWNSFFRNNFKPEATVLHSLPVSRSRLWMTFVISGLLFVTFSALIILAVIGLCMPQQLMDSLRQLLDQSPDSGFSLIHLMGVSMWLHSYRNQDYQRRNSIIRNGLGCSTLDH